MPAFSLGEPTTKSTTNPVFSSPLQLMYRSSHTCEHLTGGEGIVEVVLEDCVVTLTKGEVVSPSPSLALVGSLQCGRWQVGHVHLGSYGGGRYVCMVGGGGGGQVVGVGQGAPVVTGGHGGR